MKSDVVDSSERLECAMPTIGKKWNPTIILQLVSKGPLRFNVLRRALSTITSTTLQQRLRQLEHEGIVKKSSPFLPPPATYEISEFGVAIYQILHEISELIASRLVNGSPTIRKDDHLNKRSTQ